MGHGVMRNGHKSAFVWVSVSWVTACDKLPALTTDSKESKQVYRLRQFDVQSEICFGRGNAENPNLIYSVIQCDY